MSFNSLQAIFDDDVLGLLDSKESAPSVTPDERLVTSLQEINHFFEEHKREPAPVASDIHQYKLFSRLTAIRQDPKKIEFLKPYDEFNLLIGTQIPASINEIIEDEDLALPVDNEGILSLSNLPKHIDTSDYIGHQRPCKDFDNFKSRFEQCYQDLDNDKRITRQFTNEQQIEVGQYFILKGVMIYIAEKGTLVKDKNDKVNTRLRIIYENGTESDLLLRSLARELYRDGRRITEHNDNLLAGFEQINADDLINGWIYVLSSLSDDAEVQSIKNLFKIGFSTTPVEIRIANAKSDPTYLMAPVHVMQTYKCFNLNPQKFEQLLHRFFSQVRLELYVTEKFNNKYSPKEWFVVPFPIIDQAVQLIINGEIIHYSFDYRTLSIVEAR